MEEFRGRHHPESQENISHFTHLTGSILPQLRFEGVPEKRETVARSLLALGLYLQWLDRFEDVRESECRATGGHHGFMIIRKI